MRSQPSSNSWTEHLQLYFIIVEVTWITVNILIYELDALCIFDFNIVRPLLKFACSIRMIKTILFWIGVEFYNLKSFVAYNHSSALDTD